MGENFERRENFQFRVLVNDRVKDPVEEHLASMGDQLMRNHRNRFPPSGSLKRLADRQGSRRDCVNSCKPSMLPDHDPHKFTGALAFSARFKDFQNPALRVALG